MRHLTFALLISTLPAYAGLGASTYCESPSAPNAQTQLRSVASQSSRIIARISDDSSDHSVEAENRFVELINAERASQGAGALLAEPDLNAVALAHCRFLTGEYPTSWNKTSPITGRPVNSHYGKAGEDSCYRVVQGADKSLGFLYGAGENNALVGQSDISDSETVASGFVQQFMNSPGHRKNLLTPSYNQTGVAICRSEKTHTSVTVQVFAVRMTFKSEAEKKAYQLKHAQLYVDPYQKSCGY